jgi:hypothetical protein
MKTFITTHKGKEVDRETVSDCDTIEHYINRKFGSVEPAKYDISVSIVEPESEEQPEEKVEEPVPDEPAESTKP